MAFADDIYMWYIFHHQWESDHLLYARLVLKCFDITVSTIYNASLSLTENLIYIKTHFFSFFLLTFLTIILLWIQDKSASRPELPG